MAYACNATPSSLLSPQPLNPTSSSCPVFGVTRVQSPMTTSVQHPFDGDVYNATAQKQQRFNERSRVSFALNGAIYLIKTSHFLSTKKLVDPETVGLEMPAKSSLDIDTFEDLRSASELVGV